MKKIAAVEISNSEQIKLALERVRMYKTRTEKLTGDSCTEMNR